MVRVRHDYSRVLQELYNLCIIYVLAAHFGGVHARLGYSHVLWTEYNMCIAFADGPIVTGGAHTA